MVFGLIRGSEKPESENHNGDGWFLNMPWWRFLIFRNPLRLNPTNPNRNSYNPWDLCLILITPKGVLIHRTTRIVRSSLTKLLSSSPITLLVNPLKKKTRQLSVLMVFWKKEDTETNTSSGLSKGIGSCRWSSDRGCCLGIGSKMDFNRSLYFWGSSGKEKTLGFHKTNLIDPPPVGAYDKTGDGPDIQQH